MRARVHVCVCARARAWGKGRVCSLTPDVTVMATAAPPLASHFLPPPPVHVPGPHVLTHTHARTHAGSACAQGAGEGGWEGLWASSPLP